ncbi:1,4-alpha-glucan branching protein GlgB [Conexibacter sp. SYSU D00693]|uniref:1,4-alpha-glucan branching protein GlgB n=1 Tax=Conexibacter sp. SYSU D00693 TaxID=2812560 RepID=UPI00196B589D|nr:1,4-alpha-glucan branching protein GlgB [Conexibacter sp. SYSU D00693]
MTDTDLLTRGELADPHALLGAHPDGNGGAVVRAWRPAAESVTVHVEGGEDAEAELVHPDGLFEAKVPKTRPPLRYELEVAYPDGGTFTMRDPYAFPPTVGELDLHLAGEGRHEELYCRLGAHVREVDGVVGTAFAVWAPNARSVSVVGDFNSWDGRLHPMRSLGSSGIWELFVPGVDDGALYRFEIRTQGGELRLKADPWARRAERPPQNASIVHRSKHEWTDDSWMEARKERRPHAEPLSVLEVHLGSWRRDPANPEDPLSYDDLAEQLADYATDLGFTHVELLPVMVHPFSGSWGYQVTGQFAPDARHGDPDGFKRFVDRMHRSDIGVLLDWVPAHFPKDDWALARFDGTKLYEHDDPRRGEHPDWGTLIYNLARNEVRNFLLASGLFWPREFHADGLRVDAVASMLYLDYSRQAGEWIPNVHGGREDLDSISFLRELNEVLHAREPGVISAAEESTAWPGVSRPTWTGGLGFGFKWNMGWMHDTLAYFERDPIHRRFHHGELTFSLHYAFSEEFILPLSHDECVHGKGSLLQKMPGDRWQQLANLRTLYAYQWAHPGKQLLFMGGEFAQEREWSHERSLDWHLLEDPGHRGVQSLVRDLNAVYREQPAMWQRDGDPDGFFWIEPNDAETSVLAFGRRAQEPGREVVVVMNLTPLPREGYRVGLPHGGRWREVLNTDAECYGGSGVGNFGGVEAEDLPWHHQPTSAAVTVPPLGAVFLVPER